MYLSKYRPQKLDPLVELRQVKVNGFIHAVDDGIIKVTYAAKVSHRQAHCINHLPSVLGSSAITLDVQPTAPLMLLLEAGSQPGTALGET